MAQAEPLSIRPAREGDLEPLLGLENASFASDRLSRRRLRHWIGADNRLFLVAEAGDALLGYCLILLHRGTRHARLYSLAVAAAARGRGVGKALVRRAEEDAAALGRLFMRLEVARENHAATSLYEALGYSTFGTLPDYYEDHQDALRMHKRIRYLPVNLLTRHTPWYGQTTDFTCGPAALMMAMASLEPGRPPGQAEELQIWREATTIFMTSGHGGCHPLGLGLAARRRGFRACVFINRAEPLFLEGVRNPDKKAVLEQVDRQFHAATAREGVDVVRQDITQECIEAHMNAGGAALVLISTYRLDGRKAPHWVTVTGMDDACFYLHDPGPADAAQPPMDCQHIPIARADFAAMSAFGRHKLRTAVLIQRADAVPRAV